MTIKSPIITPRAVKGWVNHSSVLGSNNYDLNNLYSPDTAYDKSCVLYLASPKYNPHKTTIFDKSGKNNHGTITGATWVRLPSGLWVNSFDGTDDKITTVNPFGNVDFASQPITILAWLNTDVLDTYMCFTALSPTTATYNGIELWKQNGNNIVVGWRTLAEVDTARFGGSVVLTNNRWYHIVCTYDGSGTFNNTTIFIYINGVNDPVSAGGAAANWGAIGGNELWIGLGPSGYWWNGKGGLYKLFNRALTATEISQIWSSERSLFGV